ncbi:MAG: Mannosyl-glycoprotein endo-beta-N-acetylglucosaminidase, partial [Thermomicrobiales bacterium]|nr:Mannosyl-glycoprotein endo-beta-N-acetylglucosaminidase [Thermomicrobiales bacterium]
MAMTVDDMLCGPARGDVDAVLAFADAQGALRRNDVEAYVREVFRLAPEVGLDPAILAAQSAEETGNWTSDIWQNRLNPAGIGITDTAAVGLTYDDGVDAAHAQIVHAFVYTVGRIPEGHLLAPFISRDPRYQAVLDGQLDGKVRTILDLTGKWATDPDYHDEIVSRG